MSTARIGVVIVEDEERARRTLRNLVRADSTLDLLAETAGSETPTVIERCRPDLLLLDVQMPGMDGFEVLKCVASDHLPVVIFITAYDRYALDAFEVAAVDYLLKPFSDDRFTSALDRAKEQVRLRAQSAVDVTARVRQLLEAVQPATEQRMVLREGSRTLVVRPEEIDWVQADGVYVRVWAGRRNVLIRESLTSMERRLEPRGFFRIHRSALVNVSRVVELKHRSHGDYAVRLRDGTELTMSRGRKEALEERLSR